jgi:hypothetical protein
LGQKELTKPGQPVSSEKIDGSGGQVSSKTWLDLAGGVYIAEIIAIIFSLESTLRLRKQYF